MTLHTKPARRTTDRIEDMVAWILVAAGLLVVLLSVTVGVRVHDQLVERGRVESAMRTPAVLTDYCLSICSGDFNEWIRKCVSTDLPMSYIHTGEYEIWDWNLGRYCQATCASKAECLRDWRSRK